MSQRYEVNCVVLDSSDSDTDSQFNNIYSSDFTGDVKTNNVQHSLAPICVTDDEDQKKLKNFSQNKDRLKTFPSSSSEDSLPSLKMALNECNVELNFKSRNGRKYSSSSSSDLEFLPLNARIKPKSDFQDVVEQQMEKSKRTSFHSISDSDDENSKILDKKKAAQQAREKKKQEKEQLKKLKEDERNARKINMPGECMNTITVLVDNAMLEMKGSSELLTAFQSQNLNYSIEQQALKNCVTWKRTIVEEQQNKDVLEDQVLLLIETTEFVNLVEAETEQSFEELYPCTKSLWGLVKKVKSVFPEMHVTLIIHGMEQYFRKNKSKDKSNFKLNLESELPKKKKRTNKNALPFVTRIEVEEAITKMQLLEKINFRCTDVFAEVVEVITMYTKSIGEKHFKKRKNRNEDFVSCLSENTATVKVDKDGKGLLKVWEEQIMTFQQVSSDVAQSVILKYPSPVALLKAYERCIDQKSAERLLENLEVRRGSGVLLTARRIGPELSQKIYHLLMSRDSDFPL